MQTQEWPRDGTGGRLPFCKPRSEKQEINPPNILIRDVWYSEQWENKFLFFNPPVCGIDIPYQYTLYVYCVHLCMMTLAIIVGIYTVTKMRDSLRKFCSKKNGDSNSITFTNPRRKENSKSNKNIEKECN